MIVCSIPKQGHVGTFEEMIFNSDARPKSSSQNCSENMVLVYKKTYIITIFALVMEVYRMGKLTIVLGTTRVVYTLPFWSL